MDSTRGPLAVHSQAPELNAAEQYEDAIRSLIEAAVRIASLLPPTTSAAALPSNIPNITEAGTATDDHLSDVHSLYLRANPARRNRYFASHTDLSFGYLISALGDKLVHELTRKDARSFTEWLAQKHHLRTGSIRRIITPIAAALTTYLQENELSRPNPFKAIKIPNEGRDAQRRQPFSLPALGLLVSTCMREDDDVRWLIALIADTGARMSEVAGLALADLKPYEDIPQVQFIEHSWRGLKNRGSVRTVPLVGASLWAAQRIQEAAVSGQVFAFPRYTNDARCNGNGASATVGKWMRTAGLDHSAHDLRHTMADRLRAIQCPDEIRHAIGGWTTRGMAAKYGNGYGLEVMREWMLKC
jgi:integrase